MVTGRFLNPTLFGIFSLVMWAVGATFTMLLTHVPVFQILSCILAVSFLGSVSYLTVMRRWSHLKGYPWYLWLCGILGVFGNEMLYIASFKHAPAAQADLINYLWPILVITFSALLPKEKFTPKYVVAGICAFMGLYILLTRGQGFAGFDEAYIWGYLAALGSAILWSLYTLVSRAYGRTAPEMIGLYCGVGVCVSLGIHAHMETTVALSMQDILILILMGVTTHSLAYFFWDYGVKKGNFRLLGVLSYGSPILSLGILIMAGFAEYSVYLLWATLLVSIGGVLAGVSFRPSLQKYWKVVSHLWLFILKDHYKRSSASL